MCIQSYLTSGTRRPSDVRGLKGTGSAKSNRHDDDYWERLKGQFENCEYDHTGAYSEYGPKRVNGVTELEARMENTEKNLNSVTYQHMNHLDEFNPRSSDRLLHLTKLKFGAVK